MAAMPWVARDLMKLSMRRIVLFTKDMPGMIAFYREILGLRLLKDEPGKGDLRYIIESIEPLREEAAGGSWSSIRVTAT